MTFLSGFAEGFINERNKVRDRRNEVDDMQFQYRMKYLTDQREKRDKKKLEETKWAQEAKDLAAQFGNPDAAASFYKERANGVEYTTLQKRIAEGAIQENSNWTAPTQKIKIPTGVSMTEEPLDAQFPKNERVDKMIDQADPTLRKPVQSEQNEFSTLIDEPNSQFIYKPKNEIEVGDYDDAVYQREVARKNGDIAGVEAADLKIRSHEMALTRKAFIEAREKDKGTKLYVVKDSKGKMLSSPFTGEERPDGFWNTSVPTRDANGNRGKIVNIEEGQELMEIRPDTFEVLEKLTNNFSKSAAKVNEGQSYAISALGSARGMIQILNETPEVTTDVAGAAEWARDLTAEVKTAYDLVANGEAEIDAAFAANDANAVQNLIHEQIKNVKDLEERAMSGTGLMGPRNQRIASNKAVYRSLARLYTYQIAAANGISAAKMSDKDFTIFSEISGGEKKNRDDVLRAIQNSYVGIMNNLDAMKSPINNSREIALFKEWYGLDPGLEIPRIGQQLMDMQFEGEGGEERRAGLLATLKEISGKQEMGKLRAVSDARRNSLDPAINQVEEEQPIKVTSKEEYDALPTGTVYLDPNGKKRTKK